MKKDEFLERIKGELELEENEILESSPLHLTSLNHLTLISFIDENFGVRVKAVDLWGIDRVDKLIALIGPDKFE